MQSSLSAVKLCMKLMSLPGGLCCTDLQFAYFFENKNPLTFSNYHSTVNIFIVPNDVQLLHRLLYPSRLRIQ